MNNPLEMASPQESTNWQKDCSLLNERGIRLLKSGQWSDVKLLVGPEQIPFTAHKLILAMASLHFELMFYGSVPEKGDTVHINDVHPDAMRHLLHYIYTDEITLESYESVCNLYRVAHRYMLPHLVRECTLYLSKNIQPEYACHAYEFAKVFEEETLMDQAVKVIIANTQTAITSNSFKDCDLSTVEKVFTFDPLNINSEIDLVEALKRYADSLKVIDKIEPAESTHKEDPKPECSKKSRERQEKATNNEALMSPEILRLLRGVLQQIRFLTLTPKQFAECSATSALLTSSEIMGIMYNISSPYTSKLMPGGFSTCRTPRNRGRPQGTFRTLIPDFRNNRYFESETFYIRNLPWSVYTREEHGYLAFYVVCMWDTASTTWTCEVKCQFRLLSTLLDEPYVKDVEIKLNKEDNFAGFSDFLPIADVENPDNGYMINDGIRVEVHIEAEEPADKDA